jgi:hypothetical protein
MIHTDNAVRMLQAVAMIVGTALLLWSVGLPTFFNVASAASITSASDTLSNSAPSGLSNHTIVFTTPNGMAQGETMTVAFEADFDTTSIGIEDIDLLINGNSSTTNDGAAGAGAWGVSGLGTDTLTFTTPTDMGVASSTEVTVLIGTNASGGDDQIGNPSATSSYQIAIDGTMQDSGVVLVAIIDQVTVTASIDTTLEFTVSGVVDGQTVNGSPTTTAATTTNTTLPFGTLSAGVSKTLAQDLAVSTNAANGFSVTVEQTGNLQSSTGADIDGFIDGAYTTTPADWTGPGTLIADENTYGHWGVTSDDTDTARAAEFGADEWVAASTTPTIVMGHDGPSDGATAGEGATRVGYQIQISTLQEAGDDYNTTLRYIATPTF